MKDEDEETKPKFNPSIDARDGTTRAHTFQGTGGNTYTQMSTIVKLHTFSLYYL